MKYGHYLYRSIILDEKGKNLNVHSASCLPMSILEPVEGKGKEVGKKRIIVQILIQPHYSFTFVLPSVFQSNLFHYFYKRRPLPENRFIMLQNTLILLHNTFIIL